MDSKELDFCCIQSCSILVICLITFKGNQIALDRVLVPNYAFYELMVAIWDRVLSCRKKLENDKMVHSFLYYLRQGGIKFTTVCLSVRPSFRPSFRSSFRPSVRLLAGLRYSQR